MDLPDLEGTWALEIVVVTASRVPVLGEVRSRSHSWIRLDLRPDGDGWVQDHRFCGGEVRAPVGRVEIPDPYVQAAAPKRYPVELRVGDGGWHYVADTRPFEIGFDPACEQVPTGPEDPCVRDADGDGHPGVTLYARAPIFRAVEIYVAQRTHPVLEGTWDTPDHVGGRARMEELSSRVLGASSPRFASPPEHRLLAEETVFSMWRLPDGADCAEVRARFGDR